MRRSADGLRLEANRLMKALDDYPASPISKYGEKIGSNSQPSNAIEELIVKREAIRTKAESCMDSANEIDNLLDRIDSAMELLTSEERNSIRVRYIEDTSQVQAANILHCSMNAMYKRINKGIQKISIYLYGIKATWRIALI